MNSIRYIALTTGFAAALGACGKHDSRPVASAAPASVPAASASPNEAVASSSSDDASSTQSASNTSSTTSSSSSATTASSPEPESKRPDVIYVPTPQPVVDKMLELAQVKKTDVVYDLGCGDGRIVVTAAKRYGVKAWGFDVDPQRIAEARENVRAAGVEDLVTIEQKDIFTLDLSPATVVTLYLLPRLNVRLIPQLEKLRPGARIVSHDFDMQGVTPLKHVSMSPPGAGEHSVYLWKTPLQKQSSTAVSATP